MKKLLLICIALISINAFGQDEIIGYVTYLRVLNYDGTPDQDTFNLYFGHYVGYFEIKNSKDNEEVEVKPTTEDENDLSFDINFDSKGGYALETNFYSNTISSRSSLILNGESETFIVTEKVSSIPWIIKDESKTIGKLTCHKAMAKFRGRNYTVWFTNDIPLNFGPWKLQGLPGLILEAVDDTQEVSFFVTKISFPNQNKREFPVLNNHKFKTISLEEYVSLRKNQEEEFISLINSKLPRGATFSSISNSANSIELTYDLDE